MNAENKAGAQFVHMVTFSQMRGQISPSQRKRMEAASKAPKAQQGVFAGPEKPLTFEGKGTARDAISELLRLPGACPHVENPQTPTCLYGIDAKAMPKWFSDLEDAAGSSKVPYTVKGKERFRKQRADTPIILGVVASFPDKDFKNNPEYASWKDRAVGWMKNKYGHNLITIMEHVDEAHGHIHGIVASNGQTVNPLHDGERARMQAKADGLDDKAVVGRVFAALRNFQDDYYLNVGAPSLQARTSVRRARFSIEDYRAFEAEKAAIKKLADKVQEDREEADRRIKRAHELRIEQENDETRVKKRFILVNERTKTLLDSEKKLNKDRADVGAREKKLSSDQNFLTECLKLIPSQLKDEVLEHMKQAEKREALEKKIAKQMLLINNFFAAYDVETRKNSSKGLSPR